MVKHFSVMGTGSEQLLARLMNVMNLSRDENARYGHVTDGTSKLLADTLNEAEDYLDKNERFVDGMVRRGDMS